MRLIKRVLLLLALLMPLSVWAADTETLINYADDPATTGKVKAALAKDTRLSALDIKVKSDDLGAVHLSGSAKSQAEISQAVIVARSVSGVVSVQNDIVIDAPDSVKTK
ncbi:BON domain-containing protein [Methylobacillus gramineus]|uniref:BON domain-containing protein n=1 Tax=Methylobacillus gramineus TaxID=755169 RepID=UPI001CFFACC2|nr:BON domain-containing protein [Methylobacillus gramineus]MCB5184653.1 BON domain-containing protein [Methylobacillus gramineus]